jgi:SpoVK/Ycf46/Vps4 family AAA+-type ATPase
MTIEDLINKKDYLTALDEIAKQPSSPELEFYRAKALIGLDKIDEAEAILKALDGIYNQDRVAITLAMLYRNLKKYAEAKYWLGVAMRYKTTQAQASVIFEQVQALSPEAFSDKDERIIQIKPTKTDITFKDVVGMYALKRFLKLHVIDAIRRRDEYLKLGKRLTSASILYGPPGTGKTLTAKALAGETNAYFLSAHINQLVGSYVGVTSKNLATLFLQARMHTPCIVFIDEIDIIGTKRGNDSDAHSNVMKQAVNQLLTELDGIDKSMDNIFVLTATNRPWDIDPALKRSKRLGASVYLPIPTEKERKDILKYYLKKLPNGYSVNISRIGRATPFYSPSDLDTIVDESLLRCLDRKDKKITTTDLLMTIRDHKSSTLNWFEMTKNELQGRPMYNYNPQGELQITGYEGGRLSPEERDEYAPLIKDIIKYTKPATKKRSFISSLISRYVG